MFSTAGINTEEKKSVSQFMGYAEQEAKINSISVKTSGKGSKNIVFNMETRPVDTVANKGFTPHADATAGGQIARINMYSFWQKDLDVEGSDNNKKFVTDIGYLADKLGVRAKVDAITGVSSLEEYVEKLNSILTNIYRFWKITVEEYAKSTGGVGRNYSLGTWPASKGEHRFICCADKAGMVKFNPQYDYKKAEVPQEASTGTGDSSDLPF